FLGTWFAGVQFFGASPTVPPVARQEARDADAGVPARAPELPPVRPIVHLDDAKQREDLPNRSGQDAPPAAPAPVPPEAPVEAEAPARAKDGPKSTASLYARVRQVVRENKTE